MQRDVIVNRKDDLIHLKNFCIHLTCQCVGNNPDGVNCHNLEMLNPYTVRNMHAYRRQVRQLTG